MSLYKCEKCGIETSTSECPKCHSRTTPLMHIYWSKSKNVPVIDFLSIENDDYISLASDIRPVFPEERLLIECLLDTPLKYLKSSCWRITNGIYIIDGN